MLLSDKYYYNMTEATSGGNTAMDQEISELSANLQSLELEERKIRLRLEVQAKQKTLVGLQRHLDTSSSPRASIHDAYGFDTQHQTPDVRPRGIDGVLPRVDLDPQAFLHHNQGNNNKYRHIVDFIPKSAVHSDEEYELLDGLSIRVKGRNSQTKLETVTPAQWVSANARILADIMVNDHTRLSPNQVLDYLAYTTKVGELATKFTWSSVIQYDDDYRSLQQQYGFRWGSDTPHLSTLNLELRGKAQKAKKEPIKAVCRFYNSGVCSYQPCRFKHVCSDCGADHPKSSHDVSAKKV